MSASSRPTRRPRSRRPSARLIAVVDLPTPPLPEATAMTAAMPGISDCFAIGEAGLCGGLCAENGATPGAWRRGACLALRGQRDHGDGDAGNGAHRGLGLRPHALPGAGLGSVDIDREEHLAVADRDRRQNIGIGQGDSARRRHPGQRVENLLLRYAHGASPYYFRMRPLERSRRKGYLTPTSSVRSTGADPACSLAA